MFNECPGGITGPKGFYASGVHGGIKKVKKDIEIADAVQKVFPLLTGAFSIVMMK